MYSKVLHSKLVNPDEKMDFLAFTRSITTNCLKAAKLRKELPPDVIYPRKRSWKGEAVVPANEWKQGQHFAETCSPKHCRVCPKRPRTWCSLCKVGLCMELCFKAFHMDYSFFNNFYIIWGDDLLYGCILYSEESYFFTEWTLIFAWNSRFQKFHVENIESNLSKIILPPKMISLMYNLKLEDSSKNFSTKNLSNSD